MNCSRVERVVKKAVAGEEGMSGDVCEFARVRLGFEADEKQQEVLEAREGRVILNCTRQWGKSSVTAIKALHTAVTIGEATVIVMSPSERQSGEFLRKVRKYLGLLGQTKAASDGVNELSVLLDNGSRVVALPGVEATMRGFSAVDLLIIDEAARVREEQYLAARPMLAVKNGALWLLSTPFGERGFFWKEWTEGGARWKRLEVKATECARISPEFLEGERETMGEDWFRQEYLCEFVGAAGQAFRPEWIERALRSDVSEMRFE